MPPAVWPGSCTQSPCPCGRPLLTYTSQETLKHRSGSVSVRSLGPSAHKVLFDPFVHLQRVWSLILNGISPLLPSYWGFPFAPGHGVSFLGGIQHSPVNGCSEASCNFGVLQEKMSACSSLPPSCQYNESQDLHNFSPRRGEHSLPWPPRDSCLCCHQRLL